MKAYTHEVDQREVVLDLDIRCVKPHAPLLGPFLPLKRSHVWPPLAPSFPLQLPWWRRHRCRGEGADHRWSQRAKSGHLRYNSVIRVDACQCWTFFLLNVAADGDAARHSRAPYRRRTPGGRSHLFFHSPPSKQGLISSSSRRHQLFQ